MSVRTKSMLALVVEIMATVGWIFCGLNGDVFGYVFCVAILSMAFIYLHCLPSADAEKE